MKRNGSKQLKQIYNSYQSVGWAFVDQAMVSGVNFLTGIIFARALGLNEFGKFTLLWMGILFINSIQMTLISAPMMSIGPKQNKYSQKSYYDSVILQQFCFSSFTFFSLFFGIKIVGYYFPDWHINNLAFPIALVGFSFQTQDFFRRYLFSNEKQIIAFLNDAISYLGQLILLSFFFHINILTMSLVFWSIASTSVIAIIFVLIWIRPVKIIRTNFINTLRLNYNFAKWLLGSVLLQWCSGNLFFIIAGGIIGPTAVGALKAAQNIMAVTHVLFQSMENFVPAKASRILHSSGHKSLTIYLNRVIIYGSILTGFIGLIVSIAPTFWMHFFYGDEYVKYAYILKWFAVIYLLMFLPFPLKAGLRAIEKTKSIFQSNVLCALFTICSASLLISKFEIEGILAGLTVIYLLNSIYLYLSFRRYKNDGVPESCT